MITIPKPMERPGMAMGKQKGTERRRMNKANPRP
jgi:hypothetical protein